MWLATTALAAEGMWLPEQMPALAEALRAQGIRVAPEVLADPRQAPLGAVVGLGWCTASFVSPDGLLLTNAHCAEEYLSQSNTGDVDLVHTGYRAVDRGSELPGGPSARLGIVERVTDVTDAMRAVVDDARIADADRVAAVERAQSELVARCERAKGRRCEVVSRLGGQRWQLVQSLELRDVRVVYQPPEDVAFYGGDLDNWMWPRHDADFAVLRAYVGRNGLPADPSPANVPYHPPVWLHASTAGVKPGDAVMALGYPYTTARYELVERLKFVRDVELPAELARFAEVERALAAARADPSAAARLASTADDVANSRKYAEGMRDGLATDTVVEVREAIAARLDARGAEPGHEADRAALDELRRLEAEREVAWPVQFTASGLLELRLLDVAHTGYRWATQRQVRPNGAREPGFQDRDRDEIEAWFDEVDAHLWLPYEQELARSRLRAYAALPAGQRISAVDAWLTARGGPDAAVDALFADPALARADARRALLDQRAAAFEASTDLSTDPWVELAVALERGFLAEQRAAERAREGAALRDRPRYVGLLLPEMGDPPYPDADNTLRITFGKVVGYTVRDGLEAAPQTRLAGVLEKDRRPGWDWPAALVPAAQRVQQAPTDADRKWFDAGLGDIPVDFLGDLDSTGGNSGSPTLDADGDLVGLLFDGNYESMTADWQFDVATTRSVHVDLRYVGWLLAQDPAAAWIATEIFGGAAP